jgi:hypothetical protein
MARRNQWDALADHRGDNMDNELIHLPGIKKGGDKLSPAYEPDVLTSVRAQPLGEADHIFVDDDHLGARGLRQRP